MNLPISNTPSLRTPEEVMSLARLGSLHQSRLSFMRTLLRRCATQGWKFCRPRWDVDANGVGTAVYCACGPDRNYSLVAFSHDLDPAKRSDRVIAEEWDATFTLFDGTPTDADIERLKANVPLQEAGRVSNSEISLSRANRSVRLFNYVRDCLARGEQPEAAELDSVGYLMRTTAVYGSAKFGARDRRFLADREEFAAPFQTELLAVYLIRAFTVDIVEHLAAKDAPDTAVTMAPALKRRLGVGNSTGLGMAPFLVNHPALFNNWILARETALSRVRAQDNATGETAQRFLELLGRQRTLVAGWHTDNERQQVRVDRLRDELEQFQRWLIQSKTLEEDSPWDAIYRHCETSCGLEAQECIVSLMLEPYGDLVDDLSATMSVDESDSFAIKGGMRVDELLGLIRGRYDFATRVDYGDRDASARFWYASEEKLEPRLGERYDEPGAEREHPLATGRDIEALFQSCKQLDPSTTVAQLLIDHPEHRHSVRRVQINARFPYSEINDNLIASDMLPVDLLRCKLSFFGAVKFDPRSDRWVRITMYQHAPFPGELNLTNYDDWIYPPAVSDAS